MHIPNRNFEYLRDYICEFISVKVLHTTQHEHSTRVSDHNESNLNNSTNTSKEMTLVQSETHASFCCGVSQLTISQLETSSNL